MKEVQQFEAQISLEKELEALVVWCCMGKQLWQLCSSEVWPQHCGI